MNCKIAMNGFLGRMGQSIFDESKNHENIEISVGCDSTEKIESSINNYDLKLTTDISKVSELFEVVIDFSLPIPSINAIQKCASLNKAITIGTTGFTKDQLIIIIRYSNR